MILTDSLSPESDYGNGVVVGVQLISPLGMQMTGLMLPGLIWSSAD